MPPDTKKILIVDDDKYVCDYLGRLLRPLGLTVYSASGGFEALDSVARNAPDLIILDLLMPGLSGVDFCRSYRNNISLRQVPLLVASSLPKHHGKKDLHPSWISGYIEKPFVGEELVLQAKALLDGRENT